MTAMIQGKKVSGLVVGGDNFVPDTGWEALQTGPGILGNVFGKIDREKSVIYLSGTISVNVLIGNNAQVLVLPNQNKFKFSIKGSIHMLTLDYTVQNPGLGDWWFATNGDGDLISATNVPRVPENHYATMILSSYAQNTPSSTLNWKITENNPIEVPIKLL